MLKMSGASSAGSPSRGVSVSADASAEEGGNSPQLSTEDPAESSPCERTLSLSTIAPVPDAQAVCAANSAMLAESRATRVASLTKPQRERLLSRLLDAVIETSATLRAYQSRLSLLREWFCFVSQLFEW